MTEIGKAVAVAGGLHHPETVSRRSTAPSTSICFGAARIVLHGAGTDIPEPNGNGRERGDRPITTVTTEHCVSHPVVQAYRGVMMASPASGDRVPDACTLPTIEQPIRAAEFDRFSVESVQRVHRPDRTRLDLLPAAETETWAVNSPPGKPSLLLVLHLRLRHHSRGAGDTCEVPDTYTGGLDAFAALANAAIGEDRLSENSEWSAPHPSPHNAESARSAMARPAACSGSALRSVRLRTKAPSSAPTTARNRSRAVPEGRPRRTK